MRLRPYRPADRDAVLAVFRSNVPASFTEGEEPAFLRFIDDARGPYFVVEEAGRRQGLGLVHARLQLDPALPADGLPPLPPARVSG